MYNSKTAPLSVNKKSRECTIPKYFIKNIILKVCNYSKQPITQKSTVDAWQPAWSWERFLSISRACGHLLSRVRWYAVDFQIRNQRERKRKKIKLETNIFLKKTVRQNKICGRQPLKNLKWYNLPKLSIRHQIKAICINTPNRKPCVRLVHA